MEAQKHLNMLLCYTLFMNEAQEILRQISVYSYLGVFGISLLANMVIPVPEEVVILMIGYGIGTGLFEFWPTLILVYLGLMISDIVLYYFSRRGTKILTFIYEKYFGKMGIKNNESFMRTHINSVIFFSRFVVQFRFLGPFLAGYFQIPFKQFLKFGAISLAIYTPAMLLIGSYFQNQISSLIQGVSGVKAVIFITIATVALYWFTMFLKKQFLKWITHPTVGRVKKFFPRFKRKKEEVKDLFKNPSEETVDE